MLTSKTISFLMLKSVCIWEKYMGMTHDAWDLNQSVNRVAGQPEIVLCIEH